jgi:nidogen (entactin)
MGISSDCQDMEMYWTDAASGSIKKAAINGTGMQTVLRGLKSPEGIAVDYSGRNFYFTDSSMDTLSVAKLDGTELKTLVNTDMSSPRAVVIDVRRGTIYWTDWDRQKPRIEKMSMDGSDRNVLVSDGLQTPNGLAFDSYSSTLCWGDAGVETIECIRSDGMGRRILYTGAKHPFDLAILNNVIYWTDWQRRDMPNMDQNGRELNEPLRLAIGGNGRTYGIAGVLEECPSANNACANNNGGCKFLCLPSSTGGRTCACPDGVDPRICLIS